MFAEVPGLIPSWDICDFSVSAKASLPISLSPFPSSSVPFPSPFHLSFALKTHSSHLSHQQVSAERTQQHHNMDGLHMHDHDDIQHLPLASRRHYKWVDIELHGGSLVEDCAHAACVSYRRQWFSTSVHGAAHCIFRRGCTSFSSYDDFAVHGSHVNEAWWLVVDQEEMSKSTAQVVTESMVDTQVTFQQLQFFKCTEEEEICALWMVHLLARVETWRLVHWIMAVEKKWKRSTKRQRDSDVCHCCHLIRCLCLCGFWV